mmetsp:Transcript_17842/g.49422  ORF Transcript_17842/g.49422 Transcript_17842/m.49422 type:complete len:255 (-) Transcript_17842:199-963(-)
MMPTMPTMRVRKSMPVSERAATIMQTQKPPPPPTTMMLPEELTAIRRPMETMEPPKRMLVQVPEPSVRTRTRTAIKMELLPARIRTAAMGMRMGIRVRMWMRNQTPKTTATTKPMPTSTPERTIRTQTLTATEVRKLVAWAATVRPREPPPEWKVTSVSRTTAMREPMRMSMLERRMTAAMRILAMRMKMAVATKVLEPPSLGRKTMIVIAMVMVMVMATMVLLRSDRVLPGPTRTSMIMIRITATTRRPPCYQ